MPDLNFRVNADVRGLKSALADARREVARGVGSLGGVGGLLTGAGFAGAATKAVSDYVERAKDIAKLATLAKASIAEASQLLATGEQFGVTGDKITDALRNVSQAASNTPELFKAIGVELEDANGAGRRNIDIFTDVRNVIANSQGDFRTTAGAAKILGRSVEDLYPFLRASEQQVQKVTQATQDMGIVMSEDAVRGALAFSSGLQAAEAQGQSLVRQLAGQLIPMLANVAEAAMTAGDMLGALFSTPNRGPQGIPIISGLSNFVTGAIDILAGNPTDQLRAINDQVNAKAKIRADFERLAQANLLGGGGGSAAFPSLASGGRDTAMDALRDRIDAIKEEADERERAMRKALDAFEEERQAAIRTIQDEEDARERQRDVELRAIEDESRARQDAFDELDRLRQDELDSLREEIRGTQELADLEKTRAEIAAAEGDAETERKVEIFRTAGQSANDYARNVRDQQRRIADADKRVADSKKKLEEDTAKVAIEARVRTIEEERQAARRALDEYKRGAEDRQRSIRDQMDAERLQSSARVQQIQDEMDRERKRATDEIAQLEDVTRATIKELDEQVKAHQRAGTAIAAAYSNINRTVSYTSTGSGTAVSAGNEAGGILDQRKSEQSGGGMNLHEARALKEQLLERPIGIEEAAGYVGRTRASVEAEIKDSVEYKALQSSAAVRAAARARAGGGGDAILTAATGLDTVVGPGHGGPQLILAGEGGVPEDVHIGPRGSGGGAPIVSTVNAYGIGVREAAKLIARANERALARRAGHGYGRRR